MRFDLTVPLARFVAQHINTLGTPFKRYHIAPVWRGENTQRGRYREFMQCDFDTIGTLSVAADIETGLVINDLFEKIGFERFTIHVNNRQVLTGLLEQIGVAEQATAILRSLDKLPKIGPKRTANEMVEAAGITAEQAEQVLAITTLTGSNQEILDNLKPLVAQSELGTAGIGRLQQILDGLAAGGVPSERIKLDVSIARGLDYYTGVIFETFLDDLPEIGSVCSGGRYDNLAELYTKQQLPGIGASLGLDRLLAAMDELEMIEKVKTPADILVVYFEKDQLNKYLEIAADLRQAGWAVEVFPDAKKLGKQLKYADGRGFQYALIAGGDELQRDVCQIKNLQTGESIEYPLSSVATDMK
jgi:histidyl-tRNA synthetase